MAPGRHGQHNTPPADTEVLRGAHHAAPSILRVLARLDPSGFPIMTTTEYCTAMRELFWDWSARRSIRILKRPENERTAELYDWVRANPEVDRIWFRHKGKTVYRLDGIADMRRECIHGASLTTHHVAHMRIPRDILMDWKVVGMQAYLQGLHHDFLFELLPGWQREYARSQFRRFLENEWVQWGIVGPYMDEYLVQAPHPNTFRGITSRTRVLKRNPLMATDGELKILRESSGYQVAWQECGRRGIHDPVPLNNLYYPRWDGKKRIPKDFDKLEIIQYAKRRRG